MLLKKGEKYLRNTILQSEISLLSGIFEILISIFREEDY